MTQTHVKNFFLISTVLAISVGCEKEEDTPEVPPTTVKEWTVPLSTKNENPAVPNRNEGGTATFQLLSNNSLKYTIAVTGLTAGDALTAAHLHVGDVISNGGVILGLEPSFSGGNAAGTITNVRASLVDSLKNDANQIYFNAHSTQVPAGLVRGQLNIRLEMAEDVQLRGTNEVPAVVTTATGVATFRITSDKKLYTKFVVTGLEPGDALTASHIHTGAATVNGPVIVPIYNSAAEFGTVKIITLTDVQYTTVTTTPVYANAHSTLRPAGLVRGQIR